MAVFKLLPASAHPAEAVVVAVVVAESAVAKTSENNNTGLDMGSLVGNSSRGSAELRIAHMNIDVQVSMLNSIRNVCVGFSHVFMSIGTYIAAACLCVFDASSVSHRCIHINSSQF